MSVHIIPVESAGQVEKVVVLAEQIWQQHFTPIIGQDQVAYMLKHFQSAEAINNQIADGAVYFVAEIEREWVGYMGLIPNSLQRSVMVSKLYVKDVCRGKGVGKALLSHAEAFGLKSEQPTLWLTVNRLNIETIDWYKRQGFVVTDEVKKDIGNGFFMDDFIMEKSL